MQWLSDVAAACLGAAVPWFAIGILAYAGGRTATAQDSIRAAEPHEPVLRGSPSAPAPANGPAPTDRGSHEAPAGQIPLEDPTRDSRSVGETRALQIPLRTARSILESDPTTDAGTSGTCRIRGVVTCSARRGDLFFVQDTTAGVYVYVIESLPPQGSFVEVRGRPAAGLFAPILVADSVAVLGRTNLPPPLPIGVEELAYGRYDSQWVEIHGIVTRQSINWGNLLLMVAAGSARIEVRIMDFDPASSLDLVDASVRIRGVAGTAYNDRRQLTDFHLLVQNTNALEILRPASGDPFAAPLRKSSGLMAYSPQGGSEHRARVRGAVTIAWPDHGFYLHDEGGNVRVEPVQGGSPQLGDEVEAVGFAAPTIDRPYLRDAVFRVVGKASAPPPRPVRARDLLEGDFEGEVVALDATVLKTDIKHADHSALALESDHQVFRARYLDSWRLPAGPHVVGSKVRVLGLYTRTSTQASEGFSIWLRTADDLTILERSAAWRQRIVLVVLASLAFFVLAAAAWIFLLRQRVRHQTDVIRKREAALEERYLDLFENANDIIYTHDLDGTVTSVNNSGEELFGLSAHELVGRNIGELLDGDQLALVQEHLRAKMTGAPRTNYELNLRRPDGQRLILEVNSRLLYQNGTAVGVQGIARDITDRKEAEEALRSSERQLRDSLEERERLSRDLHDDLIQSIYAAGLNLDDCTRIVRQDPESATRRIRTVTTELNRVIRDVRSFIERLEHNPLSGAEFKSTLQSISQSVRGPLAPKVEVSVDDEAAANLLPHQTTHLLHIAREALSNSVRHGNARTITFLLERVRGRIRFEIVDDGTGFRPMEAHERHGRGLRNMSARADRLGALLTVHSRPGEGTRIILELHHTPHDPVSPTHPVSSSLLHGSAPPHPGPDR